MQTQHGGNEEGFITKLNATGSALGYSTYLGGGGDDAVNGITVDAAGNVYVTGFSGSAAYPVVKPLHPRATPFDAFIAKITGTSTIPAPNGTGTTQHSAYLPLVQR